VANGRPFDRRRNGSIGRSSSAVRLFGSVGLRRLLRRPLLDGSFLHRHLLLGSHLPRCVSFPADQKCRSILGVSKPRRDTATSAPRRTCCRITILRHLRSANVVALSNSAVDIPRWQLCAAVNQKLASVLCICNPARHTTVAGPSRAGLWIKIFRCAGWPLERLIFYCLPTTSAATKMRLEVSQRGAVLFHQLANLRNRG